MTVVINYIAPTVVISKTIPNKLSERSRIVLVRSTLIVTTLSALLRLFPVNKGTGFTVNSNLPVVVNIDFTCIPDVRTVTRSCKVTTVVNTRVINNVMTIIVNLLIGGVQVFFPPLVAKAIMFAVNLSLCPATVGCVTNNADDPGCKS